MAINQQLKEYIVNQLALGVSKEAVKSALLEAGWQASDVDEAVASLELPVKNNAPAQPIETAKPIEIKPVGDSVSISKDTAGPQKPSRLSFVISDIFQPKDEPLFQPQGGASPQRSTSENEVQVMTLDTKNNTVQGKGKFVLPLVWGVVAVAFLGAAVFFYLQNNDVRAQLDAITQESTSFKTQLASLTESKDSLTNQVVALNQTITDLNNQLSIFATPLNASTSEAPFSLAGKIGGGEKLLYTLTTNKDIVVYIKNSKDANVDAALKPLLGNQVRISGTHLAGSNYLMVTQINGQFIEPFVQAPPASTSTMKTSTSTGIGTSTKTSTSTSTSTVPGMSTSTTPH